MLLCLSGMAHCVQQGSSAFDHSAMLPCFVGSICMFVTASSSSSNSIMQHQLAASVLGSANMQIQRAAGVAGVHGGQRP